MNILVIGNGFDLAHELPTRYADFLDWIKGVKKIGERLDWVEQIPSYSRERRVWLENNNIPCEWKVKFDYTFITSFLHATNENRSVFRTKKLENWLSEHGIVVEEGTGTWHDTYEKIQEALEDDKVNKMKTMENSLDSILEVIKDIKEKNEKDININVEKFFELQRESGRETSIIDSLNKKIFYLIKDNFWILLFEKRRNSIGGNWIDFESEISKVIKRFEKEIAGNLEHRASYPNDYEQIVADTFGYKGIKNKDVIENLEDDLNKLMLLLEIYLQDYVEKKEIEDRIFPKDVDYVLSFNYTSTFSRLYDQKQTVDHIHGKVGTFFLEKSIGESNIVLGIDEYLPKKRKNKDAEFIAFKKFYQRIYKRTGCEYRNWVDEIVESGKSKEKLLKNEYPVQIPYSKFDPESKHKIYIFGHSLDISDKDIIRDLILHDNVFTYIYYKDDKQRRQLITNLVKVIGQDELIRRTGGSTMTIEFVPVNETGLPSDLVM